MCVHRRALFEHPVFEFKLLADDLKGLIENFARILIIADSTAKSITRCCSGFKSIDIRAPPNYLSVTAGTLSYRSYCLAVPITKHCDTILISSKSLNVAPSLVMSDRTFIEKAKLEKIFGMSGGYVLSFSDRTFAEFIEEGRS